MSEQIVALVQRVLKRAPQWIRQDLPSSNPSIRGRPEEALAAIVAAALDDNASRDG